MLNMAWALYSLQQQFIQDTKWDQYFLTKASPPIIYDTSGELTPAGDM